MDCHKEANKKKCTCTYEPCSRKGLCCECISYHRQNGEAPGCLFPPAVEKTYDRSLRRLARCY
ncbi:DUF6485 family protein [Pelotomaculum propionicicum]|uniref:Cytosolic protein n=1 Tax=Pelotomaculum propionicicum TaxID=258475 RepID=A0A4Y7RTU3_9FIRM|nr:DUF6485 family protein [Pelotomaculum propionicicum]NLI14583.1 hypothetical protein [Peptococcaceae bacterium]TEB12395.1 hypothetical protein Pmgp_01012 [Pelotomaculum propionicicum]